MALLVPVSAIAAPTVRTMFENASQKERAVRLALTDPAVSSAVLKSARQAIVSYESVVRRYPTSSYSDDALWQAGRLALDVFAKFGEGQDRESGLRMLRWLTSQYPSSRLARQVPDLLSAGTCAARTPNRRFSPPQPGRAASTRCHLRRSQAGPSSVIARAATLTNIQHAAAGRHPGNDCARCRSAVPRRADRRSDAHSSTFQPPTPRRRERSDAATDTIATW